MKRAGLFLVLCAMLILPLTACGSGATNPDTADDRMSATDEARVLTRTMMDEGKSMMQDAKYFAAPNGRVRGMGKGSLTDSMRSAADKAENSIRQAGDEMGNALGDMPRD